MDGASARVSDLTLALAGPIKRWTDASVGYASSVADAASKGLGKFGESVTESNLAKLDFSNGFVQGTMAAWTVAVQDMPRAVTRFYEALLARPATRKRAAAAPKRAVKGKRR